MFEELVPLDPGAGEAALMGRIAELEALKSAAAAGQARAAAALDAARRADEAAAGVPAARRGVAAEVALARRDSPACNHAKENPGWHATTSTDETHTHTADYTTPPATPTAQKPHHAHPPSTAANSKPASASRWRNGTPPKT